MKGYLCDSYARTPSDLCVPCRELLDADPWEFWRRYRAAVPSMFEVDERALRHARGKYPKLRGGA